MEITNLEKRRQINVMKKSMIDKLGMRKEYSRWRKNLSNRELITEQDRKAFDNGWVTVLEVFDENDFDIFEEVKEELTGRGIKFREELVRSYSGFEEENLQRTYLLDVRLKDIEKVEKIIRNL